MGKKAPICELRREEVISWWKLLLFLGGNFKNGEWLPVSVTLTSARWVGAGERNSRRSQFLL